MRRFAGQGKLCHRFAEYGRELETMPGEACGERNLRVVRMQADNEMFVGRHRVHAHGMQLAVRRDAGQEFGQAGFDVLLIGMMQ